MSQKIFFQASLPRVGSTLLQNILNQNPIIEATATSPFLDLIMSTREGYTKSLDRYYGNDRKKWKNDYLAYVRGGIKGYLSSFTNKPIIVDKNRHWGGQYQFLNKLIPNPKIIYLVRDLRSIVSSLEKKHRQHPEQDDSLMIQNNSTFNSHTTSGRCNIFLNGLILGTPLNNLKQSILDKTFHHYLFIKYEDLCSSPENELRKIYNYINIPYFNHNFNNITQQTIENDQIHGVYGDHNIRHTLSISKPDYYDTLGEEISDRIYISNKWYFDLFGYPK